MLHLNCCRRFAQGFRLGSPDAGHMKQLFRLLGVIAGAAAGFACVAPQQDAPPQVAPQQIASPAVSPPFDVVMAIDNSGSMVKGDPKFELRTAVARFATGLRDGDRLAIVTFGTESRTPLTLTARDDANFTSAIQVGVRSLTYKERHTDIPGGVARALQELQEHARKDAMRVIVLITDGFVDLPDPTQVAVRKLWLQQDLQREVAKSARVFGIGFTASADVQLLQSLTFATKGTYKTAPAATDLTTVLAALSEEMRSLPDVVVPASPSPSAPPSLPVSIQRTTRLPQYVLIAVVMVGLVAVLLAWRPIAHRWRMGSFVASHRTRLRPMTGDGPAIELSRDRTLVGREGSCDVTLDDKSISQSHAIIEYSAEAFWLRDLRSANGTYILREGEQQARRLNPHQAEPLKHGDVVRFGAAAAFVVETEGGGGTIVDTATVLMMPPCQNHVDRQSEQICDRCSSALCHECRNTHVCRAS